MSVEYDLDETYIDTRKDQMVTLETEITELEELRQVFRVEERQKRDKIDNEINDKIREKRAQIEVLRREIFQHCEDVIWA